MPKRSSPPVYDQKKKQKQNFGTPTKTTENSSHYFSPPSRKSASLKITIEDIKGSNLSLKFVNREKEAALIVNTLASNRKNGNLSQVKLVSLFQTYGIDKTSLVRKFRDVYNHQKREQWDDDVLWIKNL